MEKFERIQATIEVPAEQQGRRLDQVAAEAWQDHSRSRLTQWIRNGELRVDGRQVKPNHRVTAGQRIELDAALRPHESNPQPEAISLKVLHEDDDLLIIDKPAGLVVHPGSGNHAGTLVNGLLHHDPQLDKLPRAGLVHRLDKETSGCLVVARTAVAHRRLVEMLKRREIHRHYLAVVWGHMIAGGVVDAPLGRHPVDRRRQVVRPDGRPARTHYRLNRRLTGASVLDLQLETGRTHQIRVHMQHIGFPLIGDPMYGRRGCAAGLSEAQRLAWQGFRRQALHAGRIEFDHPVSGHPVRVEAPLPGDIRALISILEPENAPD